MVQSKSSAHVGPEFTVSLSCLNEERTIVEFIARLTAALRPLGRTFEIVAVDDGSSDNTFRVLQQLFESTLEVRSVLQLFRNSGQAAGVTAAICEARGNHIILMDSDLQLCPEDLPALIQKFDDGFDIVSGYRTERRDTLNRKIFSGLANAVLRRASRTQLRDFGCTIKIFHGALIRAARLGPFSPIRPAFILSLAGKIGEVPVTHHPRRVGKSGWTFSKLLGFFFDNLVGSRGTGFQKIAGWTCLAAIVILLRVFADVWLKQRFLKEVSNGLVLNIVFVWGFVSVALLCTVGEFVSRIFSHTIGKPAYVVRRKLSKETECT